MWVVAAGPSRRADVGDGLQAQLDRVDLDSLRGVPDALADMIGEGGDFDRERDGQFAIHLHLLRHVDVHRARERGHFG